MNEIDLTEAEIKLLECIRNNVIEEFIKDNETLDILINNKYQKQLIKKKDSNK